LKAFFLEVALRDGADFEVLDIANGRLLPYSLPFAGYAP
jgi:hypothetical protein